MTYFLFQAKHNSSTGAWDKGVVVRGEKTDKENRDDALQGYHAYLGAYAYGHDKNIDYVSVAVIDELGNRIPWEIWDGRAQPESEEDA